MVKRKKSSTKSKSAKAGRAEPLEAQADISGDDEASSDEDGRARDDAGSEDEDAFFETPDEKRIRLAKEYLSKLGDNQSTEGVKQQLKQDVDEHERRAKVQVMDLQLGEPRFLKGHKRPVTCLCMTPDERTIYTGGKDCAILRWDVETGKRDVLHGGGRNCFDCGGHFQPVLSLCVAGDQVVSGGGDRLVRFWDPRSPAKSSCTARLHGHQGQITAMASDPDGSKVYTASLDKMLKVWDTSAKREVDTFLGHVGAVGCMDLYNKGRPLTGSADKTARLWKIEKDTHLMFSRHTCAVDAVGVLDHDRFVSGGQDGNVFLWSHASKKPLASVNLGADRWITALATIRRGNVFFSGADDGYLRAWRSERQGTDDKALKIVEVKEIETSGCINGIAVGSRIIACAIGKEHRLGRWNYNKGAKDGLLLVPLSYREE